MSGKCNLGNRAVHMVGDLFAHHDGETCEPRVAQGRPYREGEGMEPGERLYTRQDDGSFTPAEASKGPARVASEAYRTGFERIFGGRQPVGQA